MRSTSRVGRSRRSSSER
jgi:hypothetical protein